VILIKTLKSKFYKNGQAAIGKWQASRNLFLSEKNAVNKHLFTSEISIHFSQKIASSMFLESENV
jgi:hypothetical protein